MIVLTFSVVKIKTSIAFAYFRVEPLIGLYYKYVGTHVYFVKSATINHATLMKYIKLTNLIQSV